ncbi:SET and MYND domain-containing protein 4-like isoform X1 [Hylaeus volcanicus]|uniref:SET and MYND domain-containing protein 4-like isoform X1 n=2 Tax=Hylaeus volcanicus TaxID=313075 RepID=UPI0023B7AAC9|nr:SET and MYND domain-containing protein 4-like isoform X1 [Hylaeus volcanicus]
MSFTKGFTKFSEFFKTAYDAATVEPFASRFKESSTNGDREGMIKVLMDIPCIENLKIVDSYTGKDDVKATELYNKSRTIDENDVTRDEENRISLLIETLFTASVSSRLFLDALVDCARHWYDSKAFAKCLKYCECMLALPANFYNKTVESMNDFLERRNTCVHLESECAKNLKSLSSRARRARRKHNSKQSSSLEDPLANRGRQEAPTVEGKRHNILKSCSDAVTLQFDERRGRHLVATRDINAGSVLIVDPTFAFSTNKEALDRNCLHCHVTLKWTDVVKIPCHLCRTVSFCSEKCRREAWQMYHRYECSVFDAFYENDSEQKQRQATHLLLAYRMTIVGFLSSNAGKTNNNNNTEDDIPFLNDNFLRYHTTSVNKISNTLGISEVYTPHDYRTVLALETHCATLEPNVNLIRAIEAIFLAKCFTFALSRLDVVCLKETLLSLAVGTLHHLQAINCNAYEIVENVYDKETHVWEPRLVGGAIYPSVSLVNHSCCPNVVRHSYPSGTVVVRTLRFIGKGTEILDCYGPHFLTEGRLQRREYLWKKYRFLCACEACTQNWQYPLPETMNYKCRACSEIIGTLSLNEKDTRNVSSTLCRKCNEKIDCKKLNNQLRKSIDKRLNAISKMYERQYAQALPQLLEHIYFIDKFFAAPNIETIKTQQCIIQCYNQFGCTSQ